VKRDWISDAFDRARDTWTAIYQARMHRLMTGEGMQHVYITTGPAYGGPGIVGLVRDADTHQALARSEAINPPHIDVAKARASELAREHAEQWWIVDEPAEHP
jgi:hypothetical protein